MPSENYRYYCLNGTGHFRDAEWFFGESDADAIARIKAKHADVTCEIWEGTRLVAQISPRRLSA
jgi:hypothetical protein